jgi:hypothetical protein
VSRFNKDSIDTQRRLGVASGATACGVGSGQRRNDMQHAPPATAALRALIPLLALPHLPIPRFRLAPEKVGACSPARPTDLRRVLRFVSPVRLFGVHTQRDPQER